MPTGSTISNTSTPTSWLNVQGSRCVCLKSRHRVVASLTSKGVDRIESLVELGQLVASAQVLLEEHVASFSVIVRLQRGHPDVFLHVHPFSVHPVHYHHITLETFSVHLVVIFAFAPRDSHTHFQVASILSLRGWFPSDTVSIPHRSGRFHTRPPTCTSTSRAVLLLVSSSTRSLRRTTCLVLFADLPLNSRARVFPPRPTSNLVNKNPACSAIHGQMECVTSIFTSPQSFDVAANRPNHSLRGLDRPLIDSVALWAANGSVLNTHPRSACHRSHRAPRRDQTRQPGFVVWLHNDVYGFQPNFTKPRHQSSTYPVVVFLKTTVLSTALVSLSLWQPRTPMFSLPSRLPRTCSPNGSLGLASLPPSFCDSPPIVLSPWCNVCTNCEMGDTSSRVPPSPVRLAGEDRACAPLFYLQIPFVRSAPLFLLFPYSRRRPLHRSSPRLLPLSLWCLPWSHTVSEFHPRARLRVQPHHKHAIPPAHRDLLSCIRVLNERLMLPGHGHSSLVHSRTLRRQWSFDVRVQKPHAAFPPISNEFQSLHLLRLEWDFQLPPPTSLPSSTSFSRLLGQTLWAAPESTVISTISCTASTAFTSSSSSLSIDVNVKNWLCLQALFVSSAFSWYLHVFLLEFWPNPSRWSPRISPTPSRWSASSWPIPSHQFAWIFKLHLSTCTNVTEPATLVFTAPIALVCIDLCPVLGSATWATGAPFHLATFAALARHFFILQLSHVPDDTHSSNVVILLRFRSFPTFSAVNIVLINVVDFPPTFWRLDIPDRSVLLKRPSLPKPFLSFFLLPLCLHHWPAPCLRLSLSLCLLPLMLQSLAKCPIIPQLWHLSSPRTSSTSSQSSSYSSLPLTWSSSIGTAVSFWTPRACSALFVV